MCIYVFSQNGSSYVKNVEHIHMPSQQKWSTYFLCLLAFSQSHTQETEQVDDDEKWKVTQEAQFTKTFHASSDVKWVQLYFCANVDYNDDGKMWILSKQKLAHNFDSFFLEKIKSSTRRMRKLALFLAA